MLGELFHFQELPVGVNCFGHKRATSTAARLWKQFFLKMCFAKVPTNDNRRKITDFGKCPTNDSRHKIIDFVDEICKEKRAYQKKEKTRFFLLNSNLTTTRTCSRVLCIAGLCAHFVSSFWWCLSRWSKRFRSTRGTSSPRWASRTGRVTWRYVRCGDSTGISWKQYRWRSYGSEASMYNIVLCINRG